MSFCQQVGDFFQVVNPAKEDLAGGQYRFQGFLHALLRWKQVGASGMLGWVRRTVNAS